MVLAVRLCRKLGVVKEDSFTEEGFDSSDSIRNSLASSIHSQNHHFSHNHNQDYV